MPTKTLRTYLEFIRSRLDGYIISVNYRRVPDADREFVDVVLSEYFELSPTIQQLADLLDSNYQIVNDINCRPTLVGSSSIERRRRLAGRELRDFIGTTGQRYLCQFEEEACTLRLFDMRDRFVNVRSSLKRLALTTPLVKRLFLKGDRHG